MGAGYERPAASKVIGYKSMRDPSDHNPTSSDDHIHTDRDFFNTNQGGRSWQPFGGGKNGRTNFCQARAYYFRDNASFLRVREGVKK